MADPKSNLNPPFGNKPVVQETYTSGLRKFIEDNTQTVNLSFQAPRLDVLFSSKPMKYSTKEKQQWWETKDDKPFKIGLIHSKELDTRISIYGEVFDFSKTATHDGPLQPEELQELKTKGFEASENVVEEVILQPETYYTSKDFDRMYLGWLDKGDKVRRSILKQLFRFVFGSKKMADVKKFQTRLLIAYTSLTPNEKVPCDSELRNDFRTAIEYRRNNVIQEAKATKQAIGENTLYMEKKKTLLMGLRDILNTMDTKEEQCLVYGEVKGEDEEQSQKKDLASRAPGLSDEDFRRLVFIFQNYIENQGKFKGKNIPVQGRELYDDILKLLKVTLDPFASEELEDMTKMVEVLSFLLKAFAELHAIHIQLYDIKHKLTKQNIEELETQNEDLEERIRSFTSTIEEGNTDISRLLYRFAQSLLKKSEENSETIRQQIVGHVEGQAQEIRDKHDENKELRQELENINQERLELQRQLDEQRGLKNQAETNLLTARDNFIPALQTRIAELEQQLQQETTDKTVLQERLQQCEQLRQELVGHLEQLHKQHQTLTTVLQNTFTLLEQLRTLYDALRIEDAHKAQQIQDLLTQSGTQQTQLQQMTQMFEQVSKQADETRGLIETLQEQVASLNVQKKQLEGRLEGMGVRLQQSEAREHQLEKRTSAFDTLFQRTEKLLHDLEAQEERIRAMAEERDTLRGQLVDLTQEVEELQARESALQKEKEECEEMLKKLREDTTIASEEKNKQIKELEERLESLGQELSTMRGSLQEKIAKHDTLEAQLQLSQSENEAERLRLHVEKQALEAQLKEVRDPERIAELERQLQGLETEKQTLLQEAEQKRQQNISNLQTSFSRTVENLRRDAQEQQKSFDSTQEALRQAHEALAILQQAKGESDAEVVNLRQQIQTLEENHIKALEDFSEASKIEADAKVAKAVKEISDQQAVLLKQRLAKIKEEEQKREEEITKLFQQQQRKLDQSEEEKARLRSEYEAVIEQLTSQLQEKTKELQGLIEELSRSEEKSAELEAQIEILEANNAALREQLAKLLQQNGELRQEIEEIKRPSGIVAGRVHDIEQKPIEQKKPVWKSSPYSGTGKGPTQPTVITRKAGQGGGGNGKENCETMLTLLLFHLKQNNYDVQEFLDKAGATLDDLGQCPLVLQLLNDMLMEAEELQTEKDAVVFSPIQNETTKLVMESLENALQGRFTEGEQEFLSTLSKPITFYSHPPEEFEHTLGTEPYMVYDDGHDKAVLKGVGGEDIHLTREERIAMEDGGISLGAVTFLYLNSLQDKARLQDGTYSPTEVSKCLGPRRSQERAKTPKQKHKRKPKHKA